jgi:hypothetical protein
MRRFGVMVIATLIGTLAFSAGIAGAAVRNVNGSMTGPGHFVTKPSCTGVIDETGTGTFAARDLGVGTYAFDVCVTEGASTLSFAGAGSFVTHSGAKLRGTISGSVPLGQFPTFTFTVVSGTRRYRHATGTLTLGPFVETNMTNCDPRTQVCTDWTDTAPIAGQLQHIRRRH